jgi:hypothetical protein
MTFQQKLVFKYVPSSKCYIFHVSQIDVPRVTMTRAEGHADQFWRNVEKVHGLAPQFYKMLDFDIE